jgi:hypothetical protein
MPKLHIKVHNNFVSVTATTLTTNATTTVTAAANTPVTAAAATTPVTAAATARITTDTISSDDYCLSRFTYHCVFSSSLDILDPI